MVSIVGLRIRTPIIVAVLAALVVLVTEWSWSVHRDVKAGTNSLRRPPFTQKLFQGNGFQSNFDQAGKIVSYSVQTQNYN